MKDKELRKCPLCQKEKSVEKFTYYKKRKQHYFNCRDCEFAIWAPKYINTRDPRVRLLRRSAHNARVTGHEHTITVDDIVLVRKCKYTGIVLAYDKQPKKYADNVASLDRIDSSKGYIPGNVQVISYLANRMKQHANVEQLLMFAKGVLNVHKD